MPVKLNQKIKLPGPQVEQDLSADKGVITTRSANLTTLAAALKYSQVDLSVWEVERHVINSWEVTISGHRSSTEADQTYTNYQVKVWLKRRAPSAAETFAAEFHRLVNRHVPKKFTLPKKRHGNQYLYELGICDVHLGKLAHAAETGWMNYDCKLAAADFRAASDTLLDRTPAGTEEILVVFGNDQFNADNELSQTTAGTQQDCDGRFPKTYRLGCNLSTELVEKALTIAPVRVVICPGNHDHLTAFHLGEFLRAWFRHTKHVTIDNRGVPRKYVHYGRNLIGFTHGDKAAELKALPQLMAAEMRSVWNEVRFTEWHVGHFHQRKLTESVGMVIRTLTPLTSPDHWHSNQGYVGSLQGAQAFSWHKQRGLEETFAHNLVPEPVSAF